jgi:hypothetical protein
MEIPKGLEFTFKSGRGSEYGEFFPQLWPPHTIYSLPAQDPGTSKPFNHLGAGNIEADGISHGRFLEHPYQVGEGKKSMWPDGRGGDLKRNYFMEGGLA